MAWPTTQVATGDLVTAAQLNQLPIALAEASGAAASYTFSSIPQHWTHLMIVGSFQTGSGNANDDLLLRLNGSSSTVYIHEYLLGTGGTPTAGGASGESKIYIARGQIPGASGASASNCTVVAFIGHYSNASIHHSAVSIAYSNTANAANTDSQLRVNGGAYIPASAAAITSLQLLPSAGSFTANSIATLYGLGAI